MPVCFITNVPGATLEQYDDVRNALGEPLGAGQLSHMAGATTDGVCVVDVWETREHFDRYMQQKLGEQLARAGFPQPEIIEFEIRTSESLG